MWSILKLTRFRVGITLCFVFHLIVLASSAPASDSHRPLTDDSDLFAGDPVWLIRIELRSEAVQSLRDRSRKYVRATVHMDGQDYSDVAVHLKGSTGSFRGIDDKPGLTLDFNRFVRGRKFHGVRKFHLNNCVEDPSYVNEQLGSELFRAAGIPAPRVAHAVVELNDRRLGLYVLTEGFTEDFLGLHFKRTDGRLYDTEESNVAEKTPPLTSASGIGAQPAGLEKLANVATELDAGRRWALIENVIDVDRFITFMAVEVMICHRDGYSLARNNFRIYSDPESDRMTFLPHGMDQLFGKADLPWKPHFAGGAARAVTDTIEGRRRYDARFRELFAGLMVVERLTNRVNQMVASLRPRVEPDEFIEIQQEATVVQDRIAKRSLSLQRQLSLPDPAPIRFKDKIAVLSDWSVADESVPGTMTETTDPEGVSVLKIVAGPSTSASWRTTVRLKPGRYRFEGSGRTTEIKPLPFGKHQGAALRVSGRPQRSVNLTGNSSWKRMDVEFLITEEEDVELICELRASAGEARFDKSALRLIELE